MWNVARGPAEGCPVGASSTPDDGERLREPFSGARILLLDPERRRVTYQRFGQRAAQFVRLLCVLICGVQRC